jgi:hypothetical protein
MTLAGQFMQRLRSMGSFLAIPLGVVLLFLLLAGVTYWVDDRLSKELVSRSPALTFLENLFGDRESTRSLLGTIASALITVTSITFSLLLVAVQQAAASFSNQILEQFRNRKTNQFYFGFFVGLSLYTLITLATMHNLHHPLFGALLSILLTVVALLLILVLIYTTIEEMRGSNVIDAIGDTIRSARAKERKLLAITRGEADPKLERRFSFESPAAGYVDGIDVAELAKVVSDCAPSAEIRLLATRGVYAGCGDPIAEVRSAHTLNEEQVRALREAIEKNVTLVSQSGLKNDPQFGLRQLATIAWNNTSTAVSNPYPPILICRKIRELVWEWTEKRPDRDRDSPVLYPDLAMRNALGVIESAAVASAESKQPQTLAEFYEAYAALLPRLETTERCQVEEAVRLSLGGLSRHLPTQRLTRAMNRLAQVLKELGSGLADDLEEALSNVRRTGKFEAISAC